MFISTKLAAASAVALLISSPAFAQGALVGTEALDERIDAIQTSVEDEFAKSEDSQRFGSNQYTQGWTGSVSVGMTATTGNTTTSDLSIGGRFNYGAGDWNHTLGFAGEYGKESGIAVKEEAYATYDANRYFSEQFYMFGLASVRYDAFGSNEWDAFVGVGPGYRIINNENVTWRVQAGPGGRYVRDNGGVETTEVAAMASSRLYYKLADLMFLTNDTDVLYSEDSTLATNDIGLTFKVTDQLSTRVGYRTEYNSAPLPGFVNTDNTLAVSLVYGF